MTPALPAGTLIGRDTELALLASLISQVANRHGNSVLVAGEPGIGKSALVRAITANALAQGCQVFWGAGDELGQDLPLVPFLDALDVRTPGENPRRNAIARMLRGEASADRGTNVPAALAEQLLALVSEECTEKPSVLVIDDLQWADTATVALWGRLARAAQRMPLLLIGTMRPVPQRRDVHALRRATSDTTLIQLTSLSTAAAADLVTALAGGTPDSELLRLASGAAGNPLYITELMSALARSSSLALTDAGAVELGSDSAPDSLHAAIADRLGFVTGPTREVLRAAALLGVEFTVPDLAAALHRSVSDLVTVITEACEAGVLTESGTGLRFRHPLIWEALYTEMPAPVRAAWHLDVGRALTEAGAHPDRVARQLLQAIGESGDAAALVDEWMLDWLANTAGRLVGQAPAVAAALLTQAVANSPRDSARHGWLASRLADALYRLGDRAKAEQVIDEALPYATDPDLVVDLHWTRAVCRILDGAAAETLVTVQQALNAPGISARHRARLLTLAARSHANLAELESATQVADRALEAAAEADDSWAAAWALFVLATTAAQLGNLDESLRLSGQVLAEAQADPSLADLRMLLQINMALILGIVDRYTEALSAAREARQIAAQVGTPFRLGQATGALGQLLFETGQWDEALAELTAVPADQKEPIGACGELSISAVICFHRNDVDAARRHLADAATHKERLGELVMAPFTLAQSLDYEHQGSMPEALAALASVVTSGTEELMEAEGLLPDLVRLAVAAGDLETARAATAQATATAAGSQMPHQLAAVHHCRGLLEHDAAELHAAAEGYEAAGRPLPRAKALESAAAELVASGDRDQARATFAQALEIYFGLGAAADTARLQHTFRAHGIRLGPRAQHRRERTGWGSLTATELKIVAFISEEGLSNPEIADRMVLSKRTIGTHVSNILRKLELNSRIDIARDATLRAT